MTKAWIVSYETMGYGGEAEIKDRTVVHAPDEIEARSIGAAMMKKQPAEVKVNPMPDEGNIFPSEEEVKELQREARAAQTYPDYLRNIHG